MTYTHTHTHSHDHDTSHHTHDDHLVGGLIDHGHVDYIVNSSDFLDDGDLDVYIDETLHPRVAKFTSRLVRKVNKITETDILVNNDESESDILVHDVKNYDNFPGFESSGGLQYWNDGKSNVTWLKRFSKPYINKDGKERLTKDTKYLITHEFFHSLGLGHPFDVGNHSRYDTSDTVMSYNMNHEDVPFPMTESDLEAITQIW